MDIIINEKIRNKYHSGFERNTGDIREIVIHQTGGGSSAKALLSWMFKSGRKGYKRGIALFHYAIDRNGDVYEIINPDRWVYHSSSGRHDKKTIGIEIVCPSRSNDIMPTTKQYKALMRLINMLMNRYYNIDSIVGHGYNGRKYSKRYKNCPGNFDWFMIEKHLIDNDYIYDSEDDEAIFNIEVNDA